MALTLKAMGLNGTRKQTPRPLGNPVDQRHKPRFTRGKKVSIVDLFGKHIPITISASNINSFGFH